jgi:hypothetical protein
LQKSLEPFLRTDKIVNVERLKSIQGVEQINNFKDNTNNFTNLEKLKPEEILYLNVCDWLEPQATKINARIQQAGGIKITEIRDGIECVTEIHEFDLFHSLLGEMTPGFTNAHTKGGHLFIPELKAALLDTGEIKSLGNGFFDMEIKYKGKISNNYKNNSYFPGGTSVEQAVKIIEEAISNFQLIESTHLAVNGKQTFNITSKYGTKFRVYIENNVAKYHPLNPFA